MRKGKKIILIALLTIVVLAGTIGGVALAADNDEDSQPRAHRGALLEKVCEIYNDNPDRPGDIDCDLLKDAFAQAGSQLREEAKQQFRQRLIDEGKVTQEQLDEFDKWMESRPDFPTEEFKEWMESRPDDAPFQFGSGNHDGMKRFGGFGKFGGGFRGWSEPDESAE
jgi:hypothetical protein